MAETQKNDSAPSGTESGNRFMEAAIPMTERDMLSIESLIEGVEVNLDEPLIEEQTTSKRDSTARSNALANARLSGFQVTPEFEAIYDDFMENKISQLEAFERLGIDIDQISAEKQKELSKIFMNELHKQAFERDE